jgi:hypothetical protein
VWLAFNIAMDLALVMKILEPQQQFAANNGDVRLGEGPRFKLKSQRKFSPEIVAWEKEKRPE